MPSNDFPPLRPRSDWLLDPGVTFLNHGSFGAAPRAVLAEQARWRERMERQPTAFMSFELPGALRAAAEKLAAFVGAAAGDLVFVENATAGCNAVLHSLPLAPGDEILLTDHGYPAVRKAAAHVAARTGARLIEATIPFPLHARAEILAALAARLTSRTRLLIVDHVTSPTASIMPVAELAALARAAGARVLVDGAHAPGMLSLDVSAIGGDWYVGNCHKWLMAPKGSAFLWASRSAQAGLHPPVISHGYGEVFAPSSTGSAPATRPPGSLPRRRSIIIPPSAARPCASAMPRLPAWRHPSWPTPGAPSVARPTR